MGWGAHCPPAVEYSPYYFFSRYPLERTKLFNLQNLLTPGSWFAYFITIIFVIIREGFIQKKMKCEFSHFGSCPPRISALLAIIFAYLHQFKGWLSKFVNFVFAYLLVSCNHFDDFRNLVNLLFLRFLKWCVTFL